MMLDGQMQKRLLDYVDSHAGELVSILQDLVRIPSENTPPTGAEGRCQRHLAAQLSALGCDPITYTLDEVSGLTEHPLYRAGRIYQDRPNLAATLKGSGNGRSLLLSGHIDTVPKGSLPWSRDPFGAAIEGNRLYGRGANDMKGGVATNLFVFRALRDLEVSLGGDLLFETVIDEEFGGVNGTLAGRVKGIRADAVVLSEPSFLRVCPAQRGGRIAHVTLRSAGGILPDKEHSAGTVEQLQFFLERIGEFAARRRAGVQIHDLYRDQPDPVPVTITKIITSPWGTTEPITVPEECRIEISWQAMPGETMESIDREFLEWIGSLSQIAGSPFARPPQVEFPSRWLPGSAIPRTSPLVTELAACAERILGQAPAVAGIEGPCDMYVFHTVAKTPAVLWGARGGNTHGADEYVEIDSLLAAARVLLVFTCEWCGSSRSI